MKVLQPGLAILLSGCLALGQTADTPPPEALQQGTAQLDQLVAPIALYPDTLIAQILAAATHPEEIVEAEKWVEKHKNLEGEKLGKEVNKQHWDASVKALTQFPAVLANMNQNLAWTSELGDAYINQATELNQAIQTMRKRAQQAGNLQSNSQQSVSTSGQTIVIQPAAPDVVYVPQFDPWLVYGAPIGIFPGWYPYPGLFFDGPGIAFGLGIGIGLFAGFGWGWNSWGYDWHGGGRVVYNHNTYISNSRTIVNRSGGFARGGGRGFSGGNSFRGGRDAFRGGGFSRESSGMHSGAFSGFGHGGFASSSAFRGRSSFGGFGGGFHSGGFGGGFHGGGRR
jgi:Protein of unknown function (DUF3300)